MAVKLNRTAARSYARDAKTFGRIPAERYSASSRRLLELAQEVSRNLDDNHVGTEHMVLAIYALDEAVSVGALQSVGITREVFVEQLHEEPGPSPPGMIPLTPRACMIVVLADAEANRLGSTRIEPVHILLGVIRESQRWEAAGYARPHHLAAAAQAAQTTLQSLEQRIMADLARA
jgi:ATP-dependent Clp protease ATP-binding subunit ClpA